MLASHRLYLETEYHDGHRANFSSADLTERDFSGFNLRHTVEAQPPHRRGNLYLRYYGLQRNLSGVTRWQASGPRSVAGAVVAGRAERRFR